MKSASHLLRLVLPDGQMLSGGAAALNVLERLPAARPLACTVRLLMPLSLATVAGWAVWCRTVPAGGGTPSGDDRPERLSGLRR